MPTQSNALASVYARSLYELAHQAGGQAKISEVSGELDEIAELTRSNKPLREFLASPIIDQKARSSSLRKIFGNRVTDLTLRFLLVLNDKGRLGHLTSISNAFDQLVQEAFGRIEVDVYTAAPLGSDQVQTVKQKIQQALGKEPVLHQYTDRSMIGGLKLRIGDQLIDGSVAGKLRRMKRDLHNTGGAGLRDRLNRIVEDSR